MANMSDEFYINLGSYILLYFWLGIIFICLAIVSLYFVFKKQNYVPIKILNIVVIFWIAWIWLFPSWIRNFSYLGIDDYIIISLIMEPIWILILTICCIYLIYDLFVKKKIKFELPESKYDKIMVSSLIALALTYPLFLMLFGLIFPRTMFFGISPFPTFIFIAVLFAGTLPKSKKWIALVFLIAMFDSLNAIAGGLIENILLLPAFIYCFFKIIKNRKKINTN